MEWCVPVPVNRAHSCQSVPCIVSFVWTQTNSNWVQWYWYTTTTNGTGTCIIHCCIVDRQPVCISYIAWRGVNRRVQSTITGWWGRATWRQRWLSKLDFSLSFSSLWPLLSSTQLQSAQVLFFTNTIFRNLTSNLKKLLSTLIIGYLILFGIDYS